MEINYLFRITTKFLNSSVAVFDQHITQAKSNLQFLQTVNQTLKSYHDWQVTTCFYTAVHLVNAHLSHHSIQYRQHKEVNHALNPEVPTSISKLPMPEYEAYIGLYRMSRRSRYLVNEKDGNLHSTNAFLTYEKHLGRSMRNLDRLLNYFNTKYSLNLPSITFTCPELSASDLLKHIKLES